MECCSICFDSIDDKTTLKCKHSFCLTCIRRWLKDHDSCPMCRKETDLMELESERKQSFNGWSNPPITPKILAECGFYWIGYCDITRCPFCDIHIKWHKDVCPLKVHQAISPQCPFLEGKEHVLHSGPTIILIHHN